MLVAQGRVHHISEALMAEFGKVEPTYPPKKERKLRPKKEPALNDPVVDAPEVAPKPAAKEV